jgi:hypothetical protein
MYTKGDLIEVFDSNGNSSKTYAREILDPDGVVICRVSEQWTEAYEGYTNADALLSHLNRS